MATQEVLTGISQEVSQVSFLQRLKGKIQVTPLVARYEESVEDVIKRRQRENAAAFNAWDSAVSARKGMIYYESAAQLAEADQRKHAAAMSWIDTAWKPMLRERGITFLNKFTVSLNPEKISPNPHILNPYRDEILRVTGRYDTGKTGVRTG